MKTKERILIEAMNLFSMRGYEGVTVQDIAQSVGIKAPSLYKHYKSKQEIFDAILERMQTNYISKLTLMDLDGIDPEKDKLKYETIKKEELIKLGMELFHFLIEDEFSVKFRKMLTIEQYSNKEYAVLYERLYILEPLKYQEGLFRMLKGSFADHDPKMLALQFYSPMYLMLLRCDNNPDSKEDVLELLEMHIIHFYEMYK